MRPALKPFRASTAKGRQILHDLQGRLLLQQPAIARACRSQGTALETEPGKACRSLMTGCPFTSCPWLQAT